MATITINMDDNERQLTVVHEDAIYTIVKEQVPKLPEPVHSALASGNLTQVIGQKTVGQMTADERQWLADAITGEKSFVTCKSVARWCERVTGHSFHANKVGERIKVMGYTTTNKYHRGQNGCRGFYVYWQV